MKFESQGGASSQGSGREEYQAVLDQTKNVRSELSHEGTSDDRAAELGANLGELKAEKDRLHGEAFDEALAMNAEREAEVLNQAAEIAIAAEPAKQERAAALSEKIKREGTEAEEVLAELERQELMDLIDDTPGPYKGGVKERTISEVSAAEIKPNKTIETNPEELQLSLEDKKVDEIMELPVSARERYNAMYDAGLGNHPQYRALEESLRASWQRKDWDEQLSLKNDAVKIAAVATPAIAGTLYAGAAMAGIAAAPVLGGVAIGAGVLGAGVWAAKKIGNWWYDRKMDKADKKAGLFDGKGKFWKSKDARQ